MPESTTMPQLEVPEFGLEHEGFGWSHPNLHPDVRRNHME